MILRNCSLGRKFYGIGRLQLRKRYTRRRKKHNAQRIIFRSRSCLRLCFFFFFLNDPPPPDIYSLPLHDALPIGRRSSPEIDSPQSLSTARRQRIVAPRLEETMSNVRRFVLAALAGSVLAAAQPALAQTTLTMSSWVSPTHHITAVVLQGWATEAEKATNGRVKFQMLPKHPSAPPGTFDAVRDGLVDLSYVTASYTPARHILPMIAELPGAGETSLVNSVAYSRVYWRHFHKVGEYNGVKLLGVFTHGPGQLFTKRPVNSINDIQGLKIRTGGGVADAEAQGPGASAFVKPAPAPYQLLESGEYG